MSVVIDPGEVNCVCGCVMDFMMFLVYFRDNNHVTQDSVKTRGQRKFLDEIHGDGVPGSFLYQELLQKPIGLMMLWLKSHTGGAGLAVVLNECTEEKPSESLWTS